MKNLTLILLSATAIAMTCHPVLAKQNSIAPSLERKLVKLCKAVKTNNKFKLRLAIEDSGFKYKDVAEGLVCNGMDPVTFAMSVNATKTATYLAKKGQLKYTDLASNK